MNDILIINGAMLVPGANIPPSEAEGTGLDEVLEWQAIEAESVGWWPLGDDAYLHVADRSWVGVTVISIVGLPQDVQEGGVTLLLV